MHRTEIPGDGDAANRTSFEDLSTELLASSFVSGTQMAKVLSENRKLRQELEEVKKELEKARQELKDKQVVKKMIDEDAEMHTRYWLPDEHQRFLAGLQKYGHKDMKSIAEFVATRSTTQVRTHAQKYFLKLERHGKSLGDLGLPEQPRDGRYSADPSSPDAPSFRDEEPPAKVQKVDDKAVPRSFNPIAGQQRLTQGAGDMSAFQAVSGVDQHLPANTLKPGMLPPGYVLGQGFEMGSNPSASEVPQLHQGYVLSQSYDVGGSSMAQDGSKYVLPQQTFPGPSSAQPQDGATRHPMPMPWNTMCFNQNAAIQLQTWRPTNVPIAQQAPQGGPPGAQIPQSGPYVSGPPGPGPSMGGSGSSGF